MSPEIAIEIDPQKIWPRTEANPDYYNQDNYQAWKIEPLASFEGLSWSKTAEHLVGWAVLAPSAHNKQQWEVELDRDKKTLRVFPDINSIGLASDKTGREAHVSVGCFVANLSLCLAAYGLEPSYQISTATKDGKDVATVEFDFSQIESGKLQNADILEIIKARRAYRGPFVEDHQLPENLREDLQLLAANEGVHLHVIESQFRKVAIGKAQALADMAVLKISAFRKELAEHLVPNTTTESKVMPGNTFGLSDKEAIEVHEALISSKQMPEHFAAGFPRSDQEGVTKSSAGLTIVVQSESPEQFVRAGVALEKIWLYAQANGLGVRIMAGMIESPMHKFGLQKIISEKKSPAVFAAIGLPQKDTWPKSPRQSITFEE